jgi:uncharacterized membrane protein
MSMKQPEGRPGLPRVNPIAIAIAMITGAVLLGISLFNGEALVGVMFLVVTWGFAAFLYWGSRVSDTVALISDDVQDERNVHIHQRAALYTLNILAFIIVAAFVVDIARGGSGSPYTWLAAAAAMIYMSLLVIIDRRG